MCGRIPKPEIKKLSDKKIVTKPPFILSDNCIKFSFVALERTRYFNLDATCNNWSSDLFEMLKNVSAMSVTDLMSGRNRTYRVHSHENAKPPDKLPNGVALKDCYQIRISTAKGGIHGVFYENIFYVIWLDPLHNMYPDDRFGGLRIIKPPSTCCKERENEIQKLIEENERLKEDCKIWEELASRIEE